MSSVNFSMMTLSLNQMTRLWVSIATKAERGVLVQSGQNQSGSFLNDQLNSKLMPQMLLQRLEAFTHWIPNHLQ